ncbi:hypothetical protein GCM10009639_54130 [Kitasatospora putterlickiae]|uniref:Uncharacterized protein n=1 Tax=Kitasatospora putterlickiae TaxID=221725 RepID=A0ABN1YDR4_9ACTN
MSSTIPPDRQGRWGSQRGSSRGPGRTGRTTLLPPGVIPAEIAEALDELGPTEEEEDTEMAPQKDPSGGSGGIGGPKAPPSAPKTPPPPTPPAD